MTQISPPENLLVILGPTASGKTRLAVALAKIMGSEIISADSRQVFRGMDIGSGKDLNEYKGVPYHLIDILDAGEEFSVFGFQQRFFQVFEQMACRGVVPVLCGGSALYLDAVLRNYRMVEVPPDEGLRKQLSSLSDTALGQMLRSLRPGQHNLTDLLDRQRTIRAIEIARAGLVDAKQGSVPPVVNPLVIGIRLERELVRQRITDRLLQRLDHGLIEEVQGLHNSGIPWDRLDYYGLEYRYVGAFLRGELSRNDMQQKLNSAIHNFAKRQANWFRRMESQGIIIYWVNGAEDPLEESLEIVRAAGLLPLTSCCNGRLTGRHGQSNT